MKPIHRKKIQRGIRRSDAPCSESNSQRTADAGAQSMNVGNYTQKELGSFYGFTKLDGGAKAWRLVVVWHTRIFVDFGQRPKHQPHGELNYSPPRDRATTVSI